MGASQGQEVEYKSLLSSVRLEASDLVLDSMSFLFYIVSAIMHLS